MSFYSPCFLNRFASADGFLFFLSLEFVEGLRRLVSRQAREIIKYAHTTMANRFTKLRSFS
jgi:hypothetical protein